MLDKWIIELSRSARADLFILGPNLDEKLRLCVDTERLSSEPVKDCSLPRTEY